MGDSGRDRKARSERAGFSSQETLELPKGGTDAGARMGACAVEQALMFRRAAARLLGERPDPVRFGRFTIERRLGAGAMGVVYLARDPELDRAVAIKHLHPRLERGGALETAQRRMRREARAMARLSHANVVNIHEVGVHDGRLFLAMEYVDGVTLSSWTAGGERRWREVLNMFLQAGDGLRAAHQAGLVHRDFKPESRPPSPELPQPADRSLSLGFGRSGGGGFPFLVPRVPAVPIVLAKLGQSERVLVQRKPDSPGVGLAHRGVHGG